MTKKVTGKKLKKLLESALQENTYNIKGWKDKDGDPFDDLVANRISDIRGDGKVVKKGTKNLKRA